jgi:hypothetical protein
MKTSLLLKEGQESSGRAASKARTSKGATPKGRMSKERMLRIPMWNVDLSTFWHQIRRNMHCTDHFPHRARARLLLVIALTEPSPTGQPLRVWFCGYTTRPVRRLSQIGCAGVLPVRYRLPSRPRYKSMSEAIPKAMEPYTYPGQ